MVRGCHVPQHRALKRVGGGGGERLRYYMSMCVEGMVRMRVERVVRGDGEKGW